MQMNKIFCLLSFCLVALFSFGQYNAAIWSSQLKAENNHYILNLPDKWKKVNIPDGSTIDLKYDFTGVGIPAVSGGTPVNANFTISKLSGNKYKEAMDQVINEFSTFSDRVSEPGYNYDTTTVTIKTREAGTVLHTRYYRRSKVSNYTKYFMVIYSAKSDETYILSMNFQYKDASYDIERSAHFSEYATQVFTRFELR
jgi:hypothetical protein